MSEIHTCSYYCHKPECIKAQRNELREKMLTQVIDDNFKDDTTPPQWAWIDPNDKTQKQYLPHIGELVLFCHNGKTHTGRYTGESFSSEVTGQYINTWACRWMHLPAAYGIKENHK